MTAHRDPPRLLEPNSPAAPWLRDVLRVTSTSTPDAAQLEALALKVGAATLAPVTAATVIKTQSWLAKAGVAKLSAALLIAGAAAWLGFGMQPSEHAQRTEPQAASATITQTPAQAAPSRTPLQGAHAATADTRGVSAAAAPETATATSLERRPSGSTPVRRAERSADVAHDKSTAAAPRPVSHARTQRMIASAAPSRSPAAQRTPVHNDDAHTAEPDDNAPATTPATDAPSELRLLSRAQGLLARDPEAALETIDEHARLYPHGEFAQEREALAIDALRRLGRRQELQARARAFLQRYPASPHRDRIEAWLK